MGGLQCCLSILRSGNVPSHYFLDFSIDFNPFTATSRDRAIMVNYHRDVSKREKMHLSESERIF